MQSLGTLVEDGREDDISELPDDGGGMTERHRRRGHSRLSLASWLGFGGFGGSSSRDDNPGLGDSRAQSSFSVSTVHGFGPATTSTTRRGGEESRGKQERSTRGPAAVSRTDSSASTGSASRKPRGGRLRDLSSIIVGSRRARRDADEARERREAGGGASKDMHSKRYVPSDADSDEEAGRLLVDEYFIELEEEMETPPESTSTITPSSAATTVVDGRKMRDCPLCFVRRPEAAFPRLVGCEHRSCSTCLIQYVQLEVMENRVEVRCPECPALLLPSDVAMLLRPLGDDLIKKYEEFSLRRYLISEADTRWCPAPDCGYAVIATACAACPQLRCERAACGTLFCYHCKDIWHDSETCDEARRQRGIMAGIGVSAAAEAAPRRGILSFRNSSGVRRASSRLNSEATVLKPGDIKACPRCRAYIVKMDDGSCNHMVCTMCSTEFCWLCLKEISDLHYLSPTGCTFWGKKPWTRKKKLLWQLGTLIGAPLGIALIAGLSVPGIIFGVPVLVGRKVHHRFLHHSKARRRLVTAACVAGSLVVSPVLAVMAVGVGVPIMLAYVYGVVPLSLCRNGGCGLGERERRRDSDELEALLNGHGIEEVQEEGGIEETSVEMPVPFVVSPAPALVSIAEEDEDLSDDIFLAGAESAGDSARASAGSVAVSDAEKSILLEASARDSATEKRGWRKAEGRGDGASLAPATSLHSGLSVCTRGGKSFADSENSATMTKGRHRRPSCESGGVTSVNYDEASTKALAGSQYHYDDKSVHTLGSQAPEMLSYCDDVASTKALAGSVLDAKSLSGSLGATLASHDGCPNAQCACQSTPSTSGGGGGEKSGQGFHAWLDKSHRRSVSSTRAKSHSSSAFERPVHWRDEMVTTSPEKSPSIEHSTTTAEVHFSADGEGQERERPAARGKHGPSTSRDSERSVAGPSTAAQSHIDPFKIRALMDNMKLMVASDVEIDADDYYRAETRSSRRADSGAADAASSRSGGVITAQPLPEEAAAGPLHITQTPPPPPLADASTSTSIDALAASSSSATKPSSPPSRRVRWLANLFGSKKNKN